MLSDCPLQIAGVLGEVDPACPVAWDHPLNNGRVAWWKTVKNSGWRGSKTWRDLTRRGHDGTLNGTTFGTSIKWRGFGPQGGFGSIQTDGTSGYVSAGVPIGIGGASNASYSGWVYRTAAATKNAFGFGTSSSSNRFNVIWFTDNNIYFQLDANTPNGTSTATGWHMLTITFAPNMGILYFDGAQSTTDNTYPAALDSAALLGGFWIGREIGNGFCVGDYDDVSVWNRTLSALEVRELFLQSRQGYPGVLNYLAPVTYFWPSTAAFNPSTGFPYPTPEYPTTRRRVAVAY